jgi:type IV secretory pathway VirB10-like protein
MEKKRQMVKEKENGERLETSAAEGSVVEAASESSRSNLFSSFSPFDDPHYDSPVTSYSNPNPNSNPNSNSINPRTSFSLAVPPRPQQAASTNLPSYTEPPSYTHSAPPPLNPENQTQPQSLQQQPPAPQPHLADLSGPLDAIWLLSYANGLRQQDRR